MKVKLENNERLTLIAENVDEEYFLKKIDAEGLRFFCHGSGHVIEGDKEVYEYLEAVLPSLAQLKQFLLTKEQIAILSYALGATYGIELQLASFLSVLGGKEYLGDVLELRDSFIKKIKEPVPLPPRPSEPSINKDKQQEG